jgi:monoamine oxidase
VETGGSSHYVDARVAIVGAGLAGLVAALTLARSGIRATVYECSGRIGGRMHSGPTGYWADAQKTEWCGELIDSGHTMMRALAKSLDLRLTDMLAAEPQDAVETYFFRGCRYSREQAASDFAPVRRALAVDLAAADEEAGGAMLDEISAYDWIETRVPGGHSSSLGRLLDVAYAAECAADTADLASTSIVYALAEQPDPSGFAVLGGSDERFHIEGGNDQLPQAIAAALPRPIELGWRLEAVRQHAGRGVGLTFDVGGSPRDVVADCVILAVPFAALRSVDCDAAGFDQRTRTVIERLGAGRSAKLALQFHERFWNVSGVWGRSNGTSFSDTGYMTTWEPTRGQAGQAGILVNYTGGAAAAALAGGAPYATVDDDPAVERHALAFLALLEPVFPGIGEYWNGRAALSVPMLDRGLRCSYAYARVGDRSVGDPPRRSGDVHFTGEHCSVEHAGFMEGAARDGLRAAHQVLDEFSG